MCRRCSPLPTSSAPTTSPTPRDGALARPVGAKTHRGGIRPAVGASHQQRAICAGCVVREPCLEHALHACEKFGVWGGTSEKQRRRTRHHGWGAARLLAELDG